MKHQKGFKLTLNKTTISHLDKEAEKKIYGGATELPCVSVNNYTCYKTCDCPFTLSLCNTRCITCIVPTECV